MIDLVSEKTQPNGFNCLLVIAFLTRQSGSHLTLFASICVFLHILKWLHQTQGFGKSHKLLEKKKRKKRKNTARSTQLLMEVADEHLHY